MRCILGSGKRDVHEIEMLGTSVRWTEDGLGCEATDKRRQALLEGLESSEESKTVNSAAVKPEEIGQEEDGEMREGTEKTRFRSFCGDAKQHESGQIGRAPRRERDMHEDGESDTRKPEEVQEDMRILEESDGVTWVMRAWRHDCMTVYVHVDSDWAQGPERKSTSGGMMMVNGTVVKLWSRTQASRALSTAGAKYYAVVTGATEGFGMQPMMIHLDSACGFVSGQTQTQPKRLLREEDLERQQTC